MIKQQEHRYTVSDQNIKNCKSQLGSHKRCYNRADIRTSNWRRLINRWKRIIGSTSWYQDKRVWWRRGQRTFSKRSMTWKQNTQKMLRIEWTWEEKRLQLQNFESWTRLIYSVCFLGNRYFGKRMLYFCQTHVSDNLIKTKRRT